VAFPGKLPRRLNSVGEFKGAAESIYDFKKVVRYSHGEKQIPVRLKRDEAESLFGSEAKSVLPELKHVIFSPCVICDPITGVPRLTKPGFDSDTGVFYHLPPGGRPIEPVEGVGRLKECFSGVPFERVEYRNNLIAWLLGGLVLNSGMEAPLLVFTGNMQGIGKTKTMEAVGYILSGRISPPMAHYGEEFDKQLSCQFIECNRFITFDNITNKQGTFHNPRLASLLTQAGDKKIRILGHSSYVGQGDVLFALTANHCKLDMDLATRALLIKLYSEFPCLMRPYVLDYAVKYRREIYGELLGLVDSMHYEHPPNLFPAFRYRRWLNFVYPRIYQYFGPLAIQEVREVSGAATEIFKYLIERGDWEFSAGELFTQVNCFPNKFQEILEQLEPYPDPVKISELGKVLSRNCDKDFSNFGYVVKLVKLGSGNHRLAARYKLEVIQDGNPSATVPETPDSTVGDPAAPGPSV
jgi:hypothetical protein